MVDMTLATGCQAQYIHVGYVTDRRQMDATL